MWKKDDMLAKEWYTATGYTQAVNKQQSAPQARNTNFNPEEYVMV